MSKYWSNIIKKIEPYVPGEQPQDKHFIKLNTNENPYPPSEKVIRAIKNAANEDLRLYPDPTCNSLKKTVADYYNLKKEQIFVGNGSDEILAFSFLAFFNPGDTIFFPDITYDFYQVYASLFRINYRKIPLDNNFNIPIEKFYEANDGIIIANPNSPTGIVIQVDLIENILKKNPNKIVIIDEAYIDFGGESSINLINKYPNILIIQSLSKSRSLAGLRIGIALGDKDLIEGISRVKNSINSYTVDRIALIAAEEAFKDKKYFEKIRNKIIIERDMISRKLRGLGFKVLDSKANFIFISHPEVHALQLFNELRENNILVRYFNQPRIDNFLRVSIGTDSDMEYFCSVLKDFLYNAPSMQK
jgi:histidinol-phosphate aminotransferase